MAANNVILVGIGKAESHVAELTWAAREAQSRGVGLRLVAAYPAAQHIWPWPTLDDNRITADLRAAAEKSLHQAEKDVRNNWPELAVETVLTCDYPARALVKQSESALLAVVGSRRRHTFGSAMLGSVSLAVASAAAGPVVVTPTQQAEPADGSEVVVGLDGFERTDDVIGFAFDYAARHRRPLRAVHCILVQYGAALRWPVPPASESGRRWLMELLSQWQHKYPGVDIRTTVTNQMPVAGLVAAAAGQDLLVVGGRRAKRAALTGMLGSVSQGVLHHTTTPVAIVHETAPHKS